MKINKHTPNNSSKMALLEKLSNPENEKYAKRLDNLNKDGFGKTVVKALISAAAVMVVAVIVGIFALVGREMWLGKKPVPAFAPDAPNYIFIEGRYAGFAKDGQFSELLLTDHKYSFNEILANDCLYDRSGNEIKEIYINVSALKVLNLEETESIASRLKKYASGEFQNYYKFTLPVTMDEEILITSDAMDVCFSEVEIENDALLKEHKYVTSYKLDIKELAEYEVRLTKDDRERLGTLISWVVLENHYAVAADIDGDGKAEKITSLLSDPLKDTNQYRYVAVVDEQSEWIVCSDFETMQGQSIAQYFLEDLIDFDLDGKYELVVSVENQNKILVYSVQNQSAKNVFTVFTKTEQTGLTIREFAARVKSMAMGTDYNPDFSTDYDCEWYMRLYNTENINLDKPMNYNEIYYGIEGFADMYNISLVGWDRGSILEPLAQLYDPSTTAMRDKAEELLQKAEKAFENSTVMLDYTNANITKMDVNGFDGITDRTVIEDNLNLLSEIEVTDIKYASMPTGVERLTIYNGDGYEVLSFGYDKNHIYMNDCAYTVKGTQLEHFYVAIVVCD